MNKKYFTTPIYYVNGIPHIGSAYCTLAADTLARFWRTQKDTNVHFLTGTDENSQKTVEAAEKAGKSPQEFLDGMAENWKQTFEKINVGFDDFIRTTEGRHFEAVHEVIAKIEANGDIYKGKYEGKYCPGCEAFKKDSDLTEDGLCPDHKKAPEIIEEENYFFRLSKYQDKLLQFYKENPSWFTPEKRKNEILSFIKEGLEDISISRETAALGIPMPNDKDHKIYVWFDALINYYTATVGTDFNLSDAYHIIGKDITRFHCVIWPAMLMSAGMELPKGVFAHGFFTVDGQKMGKSLGNVIDPLDLSEKYGNDALRVGLLSSFEFGNDGDFSQENFDNFYRMKLAGGVGNLFNRVITLIHKFLDGKAPKVIPEVDVEWVVKNNAKITTVEAYYDDFKGSMKNMKLKSSIDIFLLSVDVANELLNETEVWKMAKSEDEMTRKKAEYIFHWLIQMLKKITEMAEVLLPETYPKMKAMLGNETHVGEKGILFPQIEKSE